MGRLVNIDMSATWSFVGATHASPLRTDVNVGADLCVCPDVGTLSSYHGAHTQVRPYNAGSVGTQTGGAGPRACPDETACSFEGQPQGVAPTSGSVGIGVGVQWASTVALLDTYERTDRLWNRLPGRPLMALMGRVPVKVLEPLKTGRGTIEMLLMR